MVQCSQQQRTGKYQKFNVEHWNILMPELKSSPQTFQISHLGPMWHTVLNPDQNHSQKATDIAGMKTNVVGFNNKKCC